MRRAIAADFAALDGGDARVIVSIDARLGRDPGPWSVVRIGPGDHPGRVRDLAAAADYTVLVAPETMGILEELTTLLQGVGARWLGSSPEAVGRTRDKAGLARWLADRGIPTPPCRRVSPAEGLPLDATYPAVLKPIDGAGSIETFLVQHPRCLPDAARQMRVALLQPYVAGRPMSVSYLVDGLSRPWPIGIGEQRMTVEDGRYHYRGGFIPSPLLVDEGPLRAAVASVPGLRGFVGVDFIRDDATGQTTVLEINPRPTTSIVGLTRLLPPGRLAAAWIGAFERGSPGERLLDGLADPVHSQAPLRFRAGGEG